MGADYEQDLVLITCASACNSPASTDRLRMQYPHAEVVPIDMTEPGSSRALFHGVTAVFHIGPSLHPHETEIGYNMVDAAVAESQSPGSVFRHFVYSSVLQSVFRKMLNHDANRYAEEYLMETDLDWTIVQPSHFIDMMRPDISGFAASTEPELIFRAAFNPQTRFSCLALQDLGEAVARILEQREKHFFALYPFVSVVTPMSYSEMFAVVEKVVGKSVKVQQRSFEEAVSVTIKTLFDGGVREVHRKSAAAAERMLLFYNWRGLVGNSAVLEMVLGRKATSCEDRVRSVAESTRSKE